MKTKHGKSIPENEINKTGRRIVLLLKQQFLAFIKNKLQTHLVISRRIWSRWIQKKKIINVLKVSEDRNPHLHLEMMFFVSFWRKLQFSLMQRRQNFTNNYKILISDYQKHLLAFFMSGWLCDLSTVVILRQLLLATANFAQPRQMFDRWSQSEVIRLEPTENECMASHKVTSWALCHETFRC